MNNENNEQRNYGLLRPFDLEAAKAGELLCNLDGSNTYEFLGEECHRYSCNLVSVRSLTPYKGHLYTNKSSDFRMQPLCWIENRPVYPGDVLYWGSSTGNVGSKFVVGSKMLCDGKILAGESTLLNNTIMGADGKSGLRPADLTWTPPKTKKTYWVNIYNDDPTNENGVWGYKHTSKEAANIASSFGDRRIACVLIEVEE